MPFGQQGNYSILVPISNCRQLLPGFEIGPLSWAMLRKSEGSVWLWLVFHDSYSFSLITVSNPQSTASPNSGQTVSRCLPPYERSQLSRVTPDRTIGARKGSEEAIWSVATINHLLATVPWQLSHIPCSMVLRGIVVRNPNQAIRYDPNVKLSLDGRDGTIEMLWSQYDGIRAYQTNTNALGSTGEGWVFA